MTGNSIIHVDVAGRTAGVAVNGWATQVSDFPYPNVNEVVEEIKLEGSCISFQDDRSLLVVLKDGRLRIVEITLSEGAKSVGKLAFTSLPSNGGNAESRTSIPCVARSMPSVTSSDETVIFVGSTAGPSTLLSLGNVYAEVALDEDTEMGNPAEKLLQDVEMDDEDEGKIYLSCSFSLQSLTLLSR
jgi:cleavage and polyadenylation specificity factor subunit 1